MFTDTTNLRLSETTTLKRDAYPPIISTQFYNKMSSSTRVPLDRMNEVMGNIGPILETYFNKVSLLEILHPFNMMPAGGPNAGASRRSSLSEPPTFGSGTDYKMIADRTLMLDMLKTWLDLIPICSPASLSPHHIIVITVKHVFSGHSGIRDAAVSALERIASIKDEVSEFWKINGDVRWPEFVLDTLIQQGMLLLSENMVCCLQYLSKTHL